MVLNRKNVSKFYEDFIKNDDENSDKGYILDVDAEYPKNPVDFHGDLSFFLKERKTVISFFVTYMTKETMLYT